MDSLKSQLLLMGFDESKVKQALEACPEAQTLDQVVDWIIAHEEELNPKSKVEDPNDAANKSNAKLSNSNDSSQKDNTVDEAASLAVQKKITVQDAQRLIAERQAKRVEDDRKKAIEDEKRRRVEGQKLSETRAELQDQERCRLAQQMRKEKLEKELHRKHVLEQIARDREAMKARTADLNSSNQRDSTNTTPTKSSNSAVKTTQTKTPSTECRLALRFPDGSNIVQKFSPQEQLAAVRLFVQMKKPVPNAIEFVAPPNKKLNDSSMEQTLENLGLCPASRLEVRFLELPLVVPVD